MERITAKEAEQFVPLKNDMKSDLGDAAYFTLTPSDRGEGWEDVTYYLPRRKRMYEGRKGDGDSWVYILSNESQPGMYKIGYTSHEDIDKRVKQLSRSTSVATPFQLEWAFRCFIIFQMFQYCWNSFRSFIMTIWCYMLVTIIMMQN